MPQPARLVERTVHPAAVTAFWFGIQVVWGAILAVALQSRVSEFAPFATIETYARVAAIGASVAMIVQLGVGPLCDRLRSEGRDRRAFLAAGLVVAVPSLWMFYAASSITSLTLSYYALQVGMNVAIGPYQAVISDYIVPEGRGRASAWMVVFRALGNGCGLLVAGFVGDVRAVALALAAALAAGYFVTIVPVLRVRPRPVGGMTLDVDARFRTLFASRGFINLAVYTFLSVLFPFAHEAMRIAQPRTPIAVCFAAFTLCGVVGAAAAARPADRCDKRLVLTIAGMVIALCLAVLAAASDPAIAYVASCVAGCAWGAFFTAEWALATVVFPEDAMASAMAIWNVAATVPQIVAPLITVPLVDAFDARAQGLGPRGAIVLTIAELLLGTLWLRRLPPDRSA